MIGKLSAYVPALCVSAFAFALFMVSSSPASAGGRYYGYAYTTGCCCCCVSYCNNYVRGGRYNRAFADYGYAYPSYGYPYVRGYTRRQLRRQAIRGW